jgi:uncharacterized LabA/DUF88 family protein
VSKETFNVYIDGFNLYKGALEKRPDLKWLNLVTLCRDLRPEMELGNIYYFTANVKSRYPGDTSQNRQHAYLRVLAHQGIQVVFGKFRKDDQWMRFADTSAKKVIEPKLPRLFGLTGFMFRRLFARASPEIPKAYVFKMEEKGSDVNLGSFLLRDVYKNNLTSALIITGDSDLATPIRFAVEAGADVRVLVPGILVGVNELSSASTRVMKLESQLLAIHQLPQIVTSSSGRHIVRPESWS